MSAIQLFDLNGEQRFTGTSVGGGGSVPPVTLTGTAPGTVLTLVSGDPVVGGSSNLVIKDNAGNVVATLDNDGGGELAGGHILISERGVLAVDVDAAEAAGNPVYQLLKGGAQIFAVRPGGGISSLFAAYVPDDVAVTIAATTAQTANLLELRDENFNLVFAVTALGGVIFASADPHVVGAWWDNAGTLTRSAG